MTDMTNDKGHLNGICRSIGIRPECREMASEKEMRLARLWMKMRGDAYREQIEHDQKARKTND